MAASWSNALRGAFNPINAPIQRVVLGAAVVNGQGVVNDVIGTTAALLVTDSTADPYTGVRRLRFLNRSVNEIAILNNPNGTAFAAEAIANGEIVPAGGFVERFYADNIRLGVVASAASSSFSATISDI
jgi:hypothetical protein